MQSMARIGERCMVATHTYEQAFELARRLAEGFSSYQFILRHKQGLNGTQLYFTPTTAAERQKSENLIVRYFFGFWRKS
jgi:hypothetical protein